MPAAIAGVYRRVARGANSGPRMMPTVNLAQPARCHVRVDLRGRGVGVNEEGLDDPEVGTAGEEMRREGMAEDVWGDPPSEPCRQGAAADELPHRLSRERAATRTEEQDRAGAAAEEPRALLPEVRLDRRARRPPERDDALLPSLPEHGPEPPPAAHLRAA